jgi:hypothetical protein
LRIASGRLGTVHRVSAASLRVTFHKQSSPRPHAWWEAVRPTGGRIRGGWMPIGRGRIPHDLGHMATEGHLGLANGFWGLLARGATFNPGTDRRPTWPGRELIRRHRDELDVAERLGNHHHVAWRAGEPTPVGPTFDRLERAWSALPDGGTLTVDWPSLRIEGEADRPADGAAPRPASSRPRR